MSFSAFADRVLRVFFSFLPRRLTGISVLMYHSISETGTYLAVSPQAFEEQMRYIRDRGFRTVFASEVPMLLERNEVQNTVCITLDDGYRDNYTAAFPLFKRYDIKATIFLITGSIGGIFTTSRGDAFPLLSREEIREMVESGLVEFMPHSHSHRIFPSLDVHQMQEEINGSREIVEKMTEKRATVFAYPRSKVADEAPVILARAGFTAAFGGKTGLVRPGADLYRLPRNAVFSGEGMRAFSLKLSDSLERFHTVKTWLKK